MGRKLAGLLGILAAALTLGLGATVDTHLPLGPETGRQVVADDHEPTLTEPMVLADDHEPTLIEPTPGPDDDHEPTGTPA